MSDAITGLYASYGVLGALVERGRTGRGCRVDVTMVEAMIAFLRQPYASFFSLGNDAVSTGAACVLVLLCVGLRRRQDAGDPHLVATEVLGSACSRSFRIASLAADPRFDTRAKRIENFVALTEELSKPSALKTRADWMALLDAADVPFAPINDFTEVMADPQVRHLGTFARYEHAERGTVDVIRPPLFMDGRRPIEGKAPPTLGEHTDEVLRGAGIGDAGDENATVGRRRRMRVSLRSGDGCVENRR